MEAVLSKRLDAIEKKLDTLLKRTDPRKAEGQFKDIKDLLSASPPRKGYAGVPADDPRLRGLP